MYLQSAEISNFRGIRHLKINFEKDTTALIGENAWGKSSLLAVLWMLLGQGEKQLCQFARSDLYIPIKVEEDYYDSLHMQSTSSKAEVSSASKKQQNPSSLTSMKPVKVVKTKDIQRCYYSVPNPNGQGSILKIVDTPLPPPKPTYGPQSKKKKKNFKAMHGQQKFNAKLELMGKNTKTRLMQSSHHQDLNQHQLIAQEMNYPVDGASHQPKRFYNFALKNFLDVDKTTLSLKRHKYHRNKLSALHKKKAIDDVFDAMQTAMEAEAHYEHLYPQIKDDNRVRLQKAKDMLKQEARLDTTGRQIAHDDFNFFSEDIYKDKATSITVNLIFCEGIQDTLHHSDRFALLRSVAYEDPEDGFYKIHYRITGHDADEQVENTTPPQAEPKFVTDHEFINAKGQVVSQSQDVIEDLKILNPLLRLRDRRMFKPLAGSYLEEEGAENPSLAPELSCLTTFFNQISDRDDLNCAQLNQGIDVLNFIATKYLTNYHSHTNTLQPQRSRTARDIVSQPVSIETLHSLKASLEDKRPSRSKFLLSLLTGALMMSNHKRSIEEHAKPILILEDLEGRFHPTLLLTLWSILNTIPVQKIITTNSSELLSQMPLHSIRRLCRQYYNVRCYQLVEHALNTEDARKIAFHIRMSRPSALFARCWILVEGETEVWMLNEIAGILGLNLACEGVKLIEFAQCGLSPLIKLAIQLGISYYVLTDGDDAGRRYAQTVQSFSGSTISDHLSVIPHLDIEHYFYVSGYADMYQKAAGLELQMRSHHRKLSREAALKILQKDAACSVDVANQASATSHKLKQLLPQDASRNDKASLIRLLHQLLHEIKMQPKETLPPQLLKAASETRATLSAHAAAHLNTLDPIEASKLDKSLQDARNAVTKPDTLAFDLRKVSSSDVDAYYKKAVSYFQDIHSQKKLSNRQHQAIEKLYHERNVSLLNLGLIKPQDLPHDEIQALQKAKLNLRFYGDFELPPALYNHLKHNYYFQQQKTKRKNKKLTTAQRKAASLRGETVAPTEVSLEAINLLEQVLKVMTKEYKLGKEQQASLPAYKLQTRNQRKKRAGDNALNQAYGALDQNALKAQGLTMDKVIDIAIHKKSKPGLAIMVVEAMQQRGPEAVPQMFQNMFTKIKRIAKSPLPNN